MLTKEDILQIKAVIDESIETKVQAIVDKSIETKVQSIVDRSIDTKVRSIIDESIDLKIRPIIHESISEAFADFHVNIFDPAMKDIEQDHEEIIVQIKKIDAKQSALDALIPMFERRLNKLEMKVGIKN